jgi:predicted RNA-binding protein (virulence factor B family)
MTAQDLYSATVAALPASEQLRLATMILDGLSNSADALDFRDRWSDEDIQDLTLFATGYAAESLGED